MCFSISPSLAQDGPLPSSLEECKATDIAFLLDGSGSVGRDQFRTMKTFVKNLIRKLLTQNTKFAFVQYSTSCTIHTYFNQFQRTGWESQVDNIHQFGGWTHTASAILKVVYSARNELRSIASSPKSDHMFRVDSFEALDKISNTLEKSIIAIEGTQTTGDSTNMEFAQNGFSAALVSSPDERFLVSVIGANGWRGGYQDIPLSSRTPSFRRVDEVTPDSYLGYSMAVASRERQNYIVMGAPRYKHKGLLMVFFPAGKPKMLKQSQIGAYFGAEVCVVDLDGDSNTDLILASAPMHTEGGREGKVFVYKFTKEHIYTLVSDAGVSLLGMEGQRGRFGSSLASLADLNGDGIRDVAVGAPLEDNGQGSVYIFNGRRRGVNPNYSQRISGSSVRSGLRFFGLTVAQSALDQSGDGLPDIAVGSKGAVLLLRSSPIVSVDTSMMLSPSKIPVSIYDCSSPQQINASVCFTMTKITKDSFPGLQAELNYTLKLDYLRQMFRAYFSVEERERTREMTLALGEQCFPHSFFVQCSPEDVVNPVDIQVTFSFQGLPIQSAEELRPKLASSSSNTSDHKLNFEIDCGEDRVCTDNIHLNFNFSGSSTLEVGIAQEMSVTVMVENRGENSYNTRVSLSYPHGLSYRTLTKTQGRVECSSIDSPDGSTQGKTHCSINRPILRADRKAVFVILYGVDSSSQFDETVTIEAQASSGNDVHSNDSELTQSREIGVKYSIYVIIKRLANTTNYINFTAGNNDMQKTVMQNLEVTNILKGLNLTVVIQVPVRLQGKDIWTDVDSLRIMGCTRGGELEPNVTDFKETLLKNKEPVVNCSIAVCLEFRCTSYMTRHTRRVYQISGNVSSGWIEQTGLRSASFHLVSSAMLEYDNNKYIFYSSDSSRLAPVAKIETLVEVYEEPDLTKEIIGGSVGGLLLLAIMTAVLVKVGFFKSRYSKLREAEAKAQAERTTTK
ncbi:integrin alpha-X-like [Clupea harengus]|uniref:Integrin alpha-X-like n=1 Tax=Clupea harengus TaxID=7950 RepID=A0A8M1KIS2_CLUHA|nr:integrin alpha-X-like [Clupea harengus]